MVRLTRGGPRKRLCLRSFTTLILLVLSTEQVCCALHEFGLYQKLKICQNKAISIHVFSLPQILYGTQQTCAHVCHIRPERKFLAKYIQNVAYCGKKLAPCAILNATSPL